MPYRGRPAPAAQEHWRRSWNHTWRNLLTSDNPGSIYSSLRAELDALATARATTIDPSRPADTTFSAAPIYVSRYPENHAP